MLHVLSLAQYATAYTRSWAVDSINGRLRFKEQPSRVIRYFVMELVKVLVPKGMTAWPEELDSRRTLLRRSRTVFGVVHSR